MEELVKHWRIFCVYFGLSLQSQLEYPLRLMSWFILIPVQFGAGVLLLKVLTINFNEIGGWNFYQLLMLYGVSMISQSLFLTFFISSWNLEELVLDGTIDLFLTRPASVLFQILFRRPNILGLAELIPASMLFIFAWLKLGLKGGAALFAILIFAVAATLIRAGLFLILGSFAFWFKKSRPFITGGMAIVERTVFYPLEVFPLVVQWALTFLLPLGFVAYYPSKFVFDYQQGGFNMDALFLLVGSCVISVLFMALAVVFFQIGMRKYESAGS